MHNLMIFFFAIAAGITLSGLIANTYRILATEPKTSVGKILQAAVMIFAGPVVFIGNATKSFKNKDCSTASYIFALSVTGYWALAIGLFTLYVYAAIKT